MKTKYLLIAAFAVLAIAFVGASSFESEDSDAASYGSASNPVSSLSMTAKQLQSYSDVYIYNGSSVSVTATEDDAGWIYCTSVSSGFGLTRSPASLTPGYSGTPYNVSGTLTSTGNCTITIYGEYQPDLPDPDYTVTVTLHVVSSVTNYNVSIRANPSAGGSVSTTSLSVPSGTSVSATANRLTIGYTTITATAASGYHFSYWSKSSGTITGNTTIYAYFAADTTYYNVSFYATPSAGGAVSPSSLSVAAGTTYSANGPVLTVGNINVTASSAVGYSFLRWSLDGNTATSGTINSSKTFVAVFQSSTVEFDVGVYSGSTGTGTVKLVDVTSETTLYESSAVGPHTVSIPRGHQIYVQATPDAGMGFNGWMDGSSLIETDNPWYGTATDALSDIQALADFYDTSIIKTVNFSMTPANGGTLSDTEISVNSGTAYTVTDSSVTFGDVTVSVTPAPGFTFLRWSVDGETATSGTITDNTLFVAVLQSDSVEMDVGVYPGSSGSGTVSVYDVTDDRTIYESSAVGPNTVAIPRGHEFYILAIPDDDSGFFGWIDGVRVIETDNPWYGTATDAIGDLQALARFSIPEVHWTNDNFNGRVDILFKFEPDSQIHTMTMSLFAPETADHKTTWTEIGKALTITLDPISHRIIAEVTGMNPAIYRIGSWNTYLISIDTEDGNVSVTPVRTFASFTDFTLSDRQTHTILDFSETVKDVAVKTILHSDGGPQPNHVRFSVVDTWPFLDSYGVLLSNPTINMFDYFPQFDSIRVNFYSFAIFGDSITINGITYPVTDGKVTVTYVTDDGKNYLPEVMPNQDPKNRTFDLTNIYVTFSDDGHAYLTFADKRFTIDLGQYQPGDWTISMAGTWYFATMAYEPYTGYEKSLSGWKTLPTTSANEMLLIFLGVLAVAFAAVAIHVKRSGFGIVDLIIIGSAALVAFILLG